jgi:hypothetical protein
MALLTKLEKCLVFAVSQVLWRWNPKKHTLFMTKYLRRKGVKVNGRPNYLAGQISWDGSDYSRIELNEGCTVSNCVCILTHDWALTTVGRAMGLDIPEDRPIGIHRPVRIGRFAFVGAGSILLPGADVGDGAIVGAGTVVRGKIEPFSLVVGNPCQVLGDSRDYAKRKFAALGIVVGEAVGACPEGGRVA